MPKQLWVIAVFFAVATVAASDPRVEPAAWTRSCA
jgi:hypothetical protein